MSSGNEQNGYYKDFNGLAHLAKAYRAAYVYDGIYSEHRRKTFGTKADNPGKQFVVFSQNHDQVGNRMLGERSAELVGLEMAKLMAGAVLVSPYLPMLFMGEEWAEPNPFLYFVSHSDPELIEAVRNGRKAEFADFHASGTPPDPIAVETYKNSMLQWELLSTEPHKSIHAYYKKLISLRKTEPALRELDRNCLGVACDQDKQTLMLHRWHGENHICCFMNFSKQNRDVMLPTEISKWSMILNSADERWGGPGATATQHNSSYPETIIIYKS